MPPPTTSWTLPPTARRERVYALPGDRYGVLIYTGSTDAEGTLGGLVLAGKDVARHVVRALELGRLCSNDPVCAHHVPAPHDQQPLHGAACHGCLLIAETSCEQRNELLDRALVVATVEGLGAEFFAWGYADPEEVFLRAQEGLAQLESDPEKQLKYGAFIDHYADLTEAELREYLKRYLPRSALRENVMGFTQHFIEKGIQQQIVEGIRLGLELKFGDTGLALMPEIRQVRDLNTLRNVHEGIKTADNPEQLRRLYRQAQADD